MHYNGLSIHVESHSQDRYIRCHVIIIIIIYELTTEPF